MRLKFILFVLLGSSTPYHHELRPCQAPPPLSRQQPHSSITSNPSPLQIKVFKFSFNIFHEIFVQPTKIRTLRIKNFLSLLRKFSLNKFPETRSNFTKIIELSFKIYYYANIFELSLKFVCFRKTFWQTISLKWGRKWGRKNIEIRKNLADFFQQKITSGIHSIS